MQVSQLTSATTPNAPTGPETAGVISSDFETFLKMLTVQMQNQDPLNPMQSSDFAVQLATFSGVEQQVQTNQLLQGLQAQMGLVGMGQFSSWVGMDVRAATSAPFDGNPITLAPEVPSGADRATLTVRNAMGTVVERRDIATTSDSLQWAGFAEDGAPFPSGQYSFELTSYNGDEVLSTQAVATYSRVLEVRHEAGQPVLILQGGARIPASSVTGLRSPV